MHSNGYRKILLCREVVTKINALSITRIVSRRKYVNPGVTGKRAIQGKYWEMKRKHVIKIRSVLGGQGNENS